MKVSDSRPAHFDGPTPVGWYQAKLETVVLAADLEGRTRQDGSIMPTPMRWKWRIKKGLCANRLEFSLTGQDRKDPRLEKLLEGISIVPLDGEFDTDMLVGKMFDVLVSERGEDQRYVERAVDLGRYTKVANATRVGRVAKKQDEIPF